MKSILIGALSAIAVSIDDNGNPTILSESPFRKWATKEISRFVFNGDAESVVGWAILRVGLYEQGHYPGENPGNQVFLNDLAWYIWREVEYRLLKFGLDYQAIKDLRDYWVAFATRQNALGAEKIAGWLVSDFFQGKLHSPYAENEEPNWLE